MAALYGRIQGNRGEATRMGSANSGIHSELETWDGSIRTELEADGSFRVYIGSKLYARHIIASGNVNNGERYAETFALKLPLS